MLLFKNWNPSQTYFYKIWKTGEEQALWSSGGGAEVSSAPPPLLRRACSSPVVKFCRKISVTYFNFWKVACWRRVTLLKMNTFIWYFSKILVIVVEELYYITAFCKTTNFAEQQILQNTSRKLLLCRENLRIF